MLLPALCQAQKKYDISGMLLFGPMGQNLTPTAGMAKVKGVTVEITDSLFIVTAMKRTDTSYIVKKVNENYFKISDGLKESIVRIGESTVFKKYTGVITLETDDKNKTLMFYK